MAGFSVPCNNRRLTSLLMVLVLLSRRVSGKGEEWASPSLPPPTWAQQQGEVLIVFWRTIKSKAAVSSGQCSADTAISSADAGLSTKPPQHLYATHHGALHLTYTQPLHIHASDVWRAKIHKLWSLKIFADKNPNFKGNSIVSLSFCFWKTALFGVSRACGRTAPVV